MLYLTMPSSEFFDENSNAFIQYKAENLTLEHSLVSLSKWESKWQKPFLDKEPKTDEEALDYVRCMTISQNPSADVYDRMRNAVFDKIVSYINAPMTATWFNEQKQTGKALEIVTAEIIYYWMISLNIPMECQKWHLNRLLTLIRVCNIKNTPPKKMGRKQQLNNQRALNEARRNRFLTKG
jgi:hypothetical protein